VADVAGAGRLEVPNLSRRSLDRLHTSSDGQKFEVRADSLNANYSYKYFGKGQGVSVYTFRDERDLLWYSTVFSSADRESAYVIDGADAQRGRQERYSFDRRLRL
jgi:TnpA family transposase